MRGLMEATSRLASAMMFSTEDIDRALRVVGIFCEHDMEFARVNDEWTNMCRACKMTTGVEPIQALALEHAMKKNALNLRWSTFTMNGKEFQVGVVEK